jgi:hypothetical protein
MVSMVEEEAEKERFIRKKEREVDDDEGDY